MRVRVHVGVRHYAESRASSALFVAETLEAPFVSAAAPTEEEALERLEESIAATLATSHPRLIARVGGASTPQIERETVPLYTSSRYDWSEAEEGWEIQAASVPMPVDVLRRPAGGGLIEVAFPLWRGAWTACPAPEVGAAVERIAAQVRRQGDAAGMHRPVPSRFEVAVLEVEFEPLELANVDVDSVWMSEFEHEGPDFDDELAPATPHLEAVAQCWSSLAPDEASERGIVKTFGREGAVAELRDLALGHQPAGVVLVGPPRVGKTAMVKHLAREQVEEGGRISRRIWFADPPRLVSTDGFTMDWRQQCGEVVAELHDADDVLYLGRIVEALDAGKYVGSDYNLAQFLKPTLADRTIRLVAEATVEEWNEVERRDIGFARTFTVIRVDDPPEPEGRRIVQAAVRRLASDEGVSIEAPAVERAWALQKRFSVEGSTVGRTIDFVRRTLRTASNAFRDSVNEETLVREFCDDTGLPPVLLLDDRQLDIDRVHKSLAARVMGQDEAVRSVSDVVGITKAGLSSPDRPLGSFLFVGPTGVGKTELAKALAHYLFGDESRLVRLDMSEYGHADAYARLIGEGRDDGDLTGPVRRQPFCVVLLDEIEKANRAVFDLLLQVLGEARLTDVDGRTTGFQNTIVIMTSNLGVDTMRPAIGFSESATASYADHFRREAERFFRPEFLARIDQFIPFALLDEEVVQRIAERELRKIAERDGLRAQDVEVRFDDRVAEWIAVRGWDPRYGARPLKRVIEREVVSELARRLAQTRPQAEGAASRIVDVTVPRGSVRKVGLEWDVRSITGRGSHASERTELLRQIERISALRRRLQRHTRTTVFDELEWRVECFDLSSQSPQFWKDPQASDIATDAERARRVTGPAHEIAQELAALEDLAAEAYHGRTFALSEDLMTRLEELEKRTGQVILEVLRGAYENPDYAALFLVSRSTDESWRRKLVTYYRQRAAAKDWSLTVWRPRNDFDVGLGRGSEEDRAQYDDDRVAWEEVSTPTGDVIGLELRGFAARALSRAEDGLHRLISPDGNAVVEVRELDEYAGWPWPWNLGAARARSHVARTYNLRTREISMPNAASLEFVPEDPFPAIEPAIEELAWEYTEREWT